MPARGRPPCCFNLRMLRSSRSLTLPPGSNMRSDVDPTWIHLFPTLPIARLGVVGRIPAELEQILAPLTTVWSRIDDPTAPGQPTVILDMSLNANSRPSTDVIAVRRIDAGAAPPGGWFISSLQAAGAVRRRVHSVRRVIATRVRASVGAAPPAWLREHASDLSLQRPYAVEGRIGPGWHLSGPPFEEAEPPDDLATIASTHGRSIAASSWRVSGPRGYRSQKTILMVDGAAPFVMKMVNEVRFNQRLLAEARALSDLAARAHVLEFDVPELLFTDARHGLAVVGESLIPGRPLRHTIPPRRPYEPLPGVLRAIASLGEFATPQEAGAAAEAAMLMVDLHASVFATPSHIEAELRTACNRLATRRIPSVFQHGDPGMWNCLVSDENRLALLDWENADPEGMPLWDVFGAARSYGTYLQQRRTGRTTKSGWNPLGRGERLRHAVGQVADDMCRALDIDPAIVGDLYTLCWVGHALREAATMAEPRFEDARSHVLLRAALEEPFTLRG